MGSYRFEQAPSNRSSCTNKECKDAKVKILKGELRLGSWIEGERFQGYTWRHWGCTTPKVIENIVTAWKDILPSEEPDYTMLDGYDELPEDLQLKIRTALTQGHVDDSDWKGDLEVNRPGKTGFRVRGGAKGKNAKDEKKVATTEGSEANDDTVPADKPKPKRAARSKKAAVNEEPDASGTDETEQKPAANTKKSRAKKPATAADADAPPKKRGRPTKAAATETPAQPAKKGTKRKTSEEETHVSEPEKPKRARGKAGKTSTLPNDNESAPPTKAARGRKKAPKE
ncbi:zf-PARP-domain-containing protein [Penicillium cinerascens]|uniref:Zf-PARP-domain-containing protein n=1 Tax=Penicillium cinerascens TaxID=70096 RepID=A0A9W9N2G8_9EURO|nr:zf-PARP-domain-containing protein [Penicillium cinerascens]KAJ5211951.1 zf-PARP-domain-containing protein [Penicillium cinerascens]